MPGVETPRGIVVQIVPINDYATRRAEKMSRRCVARTRLRFEPLEKRLMLDGNVLVDVASFREVADLPSGGHAEVSDSAHPATLDQAGATAVARSINDFALDLYAQLQAAQGNLFFSPFSISTALAMAYAGARGQTALQMADALRFTLDQEALHPAFGALVGDLNGAGETGDYELSVANALWGQMGFPFRDQFLDLIRSSYGGGLREVDFIQDAQGARQRINGWVEEKTHEKIKDLIPPKALNELTRLVLTNAIYFKAQWAHEFDPEATRDETFALESGEELEVPMMHAAARYAYMERDGFQVLELPYVGDRLSMVVLLPTEGAGESGVELGSIPPNLNEWLGGLHEREVIVSFPKFKMTIDFSVGEVLRSMGMTDAFAPGRADFSGMADLLNVGARLKIDDVLHKAFVEVNEEGTEAAAATAVIIGIESVSEGPVGFRADHPFHFLIRDTESGSILFMGRVMNPLEEESSVDVPAVTETATDDPANPQERPGAACDVRVTALETFGIAIQLQEDGVRVRPAPSSRGSAGDVFSGLLTWQFVSDSTVYPARLPIGHDQLLGSHLRDGLLAMEEAYASAVASVPGTGMRDNRPDDELAGNLESEEIPSEIAEHVLERWHEREPGQDSVFDALFE